MKETLTTFEAAKLLQISPYTIRLWLIKGILKGYKTAGGHRRIKITDLVSFLKENRMPIPQFNKYKKNVCLLVTDNEREIARIKKFKFPLDFVFIKNQIECGIAAAKLKPWLILLDFDSKKFSNKELGEAIRKEASLSDTVLLGFAKKLSPNLIIKAEKSGFYDVLQKPLSEEELNKTFKKIFEGGKKPYRLKTSR